MDGGYDSTQFSRIPTVKDLVTLCKRYERGSNSLSKTGDANKNKNGDKAKGCSRS